MQYGEFAGIYDKLMRCDVDYEKIADFIENIFILNDKNPNLICDLACGTGNVTEVFARRGYDMIGVDISEDMLSVAREKKDNKNVLFLNQDISKLDLYGTCDAFLCMIDGLNYVIEPKKIEYLFKRIKNCFINPDGIFVFDISSKYKLQEIIGNNTFVHDEEDVFYVWENRYIKKFDISKMYLNFFKKENNSYTRFYEEHVQRAHLEEDIIKALKKAGFNFVETYDGFSFEPAHKTSDRIVFVAKQEV